MLVYAALWVEGVPQLLAPARGGMVKGVPAAGEHGAQDADHLLNLLVVLDAHDAHTLAPNGGLVGGVAEGEVKGGAELRGVGGAGDQWHRNGLLSLAGLKHQRPFDLLKVFPSNGAAAGGVVVDSHGAGHPHTADDVNLGLLGGVSNCDDHAAESQHTGIMAVDDRDLRERQVAELEAVLLAKLLVHGPVPAQGHCEHSVWDGAALILHHRDVEVLESLTSPKYQVSLQAQPQAVSGYLRASEAVSCSIS
mmetsp:Transcript_35296/g.99927  ORF Transcript_35296/g.99927 Transcript_35296/m.99927 type:complete len:250 (+) Transcript_35296:1249-1998(+)